MTLRLEPLESTPYSPCPGTAANTCFGTARICTAKIHVVKGIIFVAAGTAPGSRCLKMEDRCPECSIFQACRTRRWCFGRRLSSRARVGVDGITPYHSQACDAWISPTRFMVRAQISPCHEARVHRRQVSVQSQKTYGFMDRGHTRIRIEIVSRAWARRKAGRGDVWGRPPGPVWRLAP